jgi:outer membrane receptor protein involved in Fe transport
MKKQLFLLLGMLCMSGFLTAQVTTGALSGKVLDSKKEPVQGAKIKVTHVPSGSIYGTTARNDGHFEVRGLRVGGPYTVDVSYLGKGKDRVENVFVTLGEPTTVELSLEEAATQIKEVIVTSSRNSIINSNRTGAATNINNAMINAMPTGNRSLSDLTRLSPQSGASFGNNLNNSNSFGGRDGRFNNLQVNGANLNNGFGLSSNLAPGGFGQPISLDAIEEIQVGVSPFDIKQTGFTGANINAVTKAGTNEFHGSVYSFLRNNGLIGDKVDTYNLDVKKSQFLTIGARLAGPIIKNKLFFFGNVEREESTFPGVTFNSKGSSLSGNVSNVLADSLNKFSNFLRDSFKYQTGAYEGYANEFTNKALKFLGRVDWNINENNKMYVSYSQMNSSEDQTVNATSVPTGLTRVSNSRIGPNSLAFQNSNYSFDHVVRTLSAELNSTLNSIMSNQLLGTYSYINDIRSTPGSLFPFIDITNGGTNNYMSAGTELFSTKNDLINNNFVITNNLNIDLKQNQLTVGASYEYQKFENSFLSGGSLYYRYNSLADFMGNKAPTAFGVAYPLTSQNGNSYVKASYAQLSAYVQDKFTVSKRLSLTAGIRFEMPSYDNSYLTTNTAVDAFSFTNPNGTSLKFKSGEFPTPQLMVSPRASFNWDAMGNKNLQVRGGLGVFTGRIPFVWLTNQVGGIGTLVSNVGYSTPAQLSGIKFYTSLEDMKAKSPAEYAKLPQNTSTAPGSIVMIDPNFKMPQILRGDLGIDYKLPWYGLIATGELMVTRDINAVYQYNANLPGAQSTMSTASGNDIRPRWTNNRLNSTLGSAFVLSNTNQGYSTVISVGVTRQSRKGVSGSLFYTRTLSEDVSSNPGSQASSAWNSLPNTSSPNAPVMTTSQYNTPHRLVGSLSYKHEFSKVNATTVSLFFEGANPGRYSYMYTSDINNDGAAADLIYIPNSGSELNWAAQTLTVPNPSGVGTISKTISVADQIAAWDAFVDQDEYLSANKGKYADRYGSLYPWYTRIDMRLMHDINFKGIGGKKNTIQFSWDIMNLPNLINSAWGVQKQLTVGGLSNNNGVIRTTTGVANPTYSLIADANGTLNNYKSTFTNNNSVFSTWYMQFGARFIF